METVQLGQVTAELSEEVDWFELFKEFIPTKNLPFLGIKSFINTNIPYYETKYWCPWYFNHPNITEVKEAKNRYLWGYVHTNIRFEINMKESRLFVFQKIENNKHKQPQKDIIECYKKVKQWLSSYCKIKQELTEIQGHWIDTNSVDKKYKDEHTKFFLQETTTRVKDEYKYIGSLKPEYGMNEEIESFKLKVNFSSKLVLHEEGRLCKDTKNCYLKRLLIGFERTNNSSCFWNNKVSLEDPRVWYPGTSRHCPNRPIAEIYEKQNIDPTTQILFPKENPLLYTAPKGCYIGLKRNKVPASEAYIEKYGTPYPVFPSFYTTMQYNVRPLYMIYLKSKDDKEFREKLEELSEGIVKKKNLLKENQHGSLVGYSPLDKIIIKPWAYYRKRINSWKQVYQHQELIIDQTKCKEEFEHIGYQDYGSSLNIYLKNYPLPDIRFFFPCLETTLKVNVVILIKKEDGIYKYNPKRKEYYNRYVFVIAYLEEDMIEGYEVIFNKKNQSILCSEEINNFF